MAARPSLLALFVLFASLALADTPLAQIVGSGQLKVERRGHSATLLDGGTVLIVGGDNQNGMVGRAEVFDPVAQTSSLAASLATARTDHSATTLADGRVLVIGGRDQGGALASTEIYDPLTATFSAGPPMTTPRSGHTATVLGDGKLFVAGGDASGSAELYDPMTQTFSLSSGTLTTARRFHSAILASTGQVLIVGGVNAQNAALSTAEVYDPASDSFYLPPTELKTLRALAALKLLPDGKVQVIGGDADFSMEIFDPGPGWFNALALLPPAVESLDATLSTQSRAALISPTISQHPLLQGSLTRAQLALLDRANHSSTELPAQNQALIVGGLNSAGQFLNSATLVSSSSASVTTDKTDYAPGSIVTISGKGFRPNETVTLSLHETPEGYPDPALVATADDQGNFVSMQFAPQTIDIGRTFTLTAKGGSSGFTAQTTFTDAPKVGSVTVGAQSPSPVTPGSDATFIITVNRGANPPASSGAFTANLSVTSTLPTGAAVVSFSPNPVSFTPTDDSLTATLTISTTTSTPGGTTSFTVLAETSASDFATNTGSLVVAGAANSVPTATGVTITGTPAVAQVLTGNYTYGDADGDAEGASTFRWLRNGVAIGGATASTYTVVPADLTSTITFEVTPVAVTGASPGAAVVSAGVVIQNSVPTAIGVTITGTPAVAQVLTGNYTYGDADGDAEGASTFRWLRNGVAIGGATASTYTVVPADLTSTITFEVTPVAVTGASPGAAVVSAGVVIGGPTPTNSAPTATGVTITGTPAVAQVLTGNYTYGDVDGDAQGASTFRWLRNGVAIAGATAITYTVVPADLTFTIRFEVTPVAATGASPGAPVVSAGVVIGGSTPTPTPTPTTNSVPTATAVIITGTPAVAQVLTGNYTYGDADGDAEGASTFRWLRDGVAIPGATASTYTVVPADLTHTITFEVTPVAATGASPGAAVVSAGVVILNSWPTATGVTITGTPAVAQVLTGNYTYGDADGDAEGASTFRWLRDGVAIPGATAIAYTVVPADLTHTITFEVTPVAATGFSVGAPVVSAGVVIQNAVPTATGVTITGTFRVRQVLTGSYTYNDAEGDAEGASTFRWLRDGVAIPGATTSTYTVRLVDLRHTITFEVTPVAATGASPGAPVVSAGVQWQPPPWWPVR